MPKALCMSGMVVAILIVLLFLVDLVMPLVMGPDYAPFRGASKIMDGAMVLAGLLLGYISWITFREQD
jgi:hypothetical protein